MKTSKVPWCLSVQTLHFFVATDGKLKFLISALKNTVFYNGLMTDDMTLAEVFSFPLPRIQFESILNQHVLKDLGI